MTLFGLAIVRRQLEGGEYAFADQVFEGKLPPRDRIWVSSSPDAPPDGSYLVDLGAAAEDPTADGQLFVSEMTHVWYLHNTTLDRWARPLRGLDDGDGIPPPPTTPWADFSVEQKAATVATWFAAHIGHGLDSMPALHDPYFRFIHLVRQGITGD